MALKLKDITAGNTRRVNFIFSDASGTPHDITGATIAFTAKLSGSDTAVIELNNSDNPGQFAITSGTDGEGYINLLNADTTQNAGTYNFGLQAILADGITTIENTGSFKIKTQYVT